MHLVRQTPGIPSRTLQKQEVANNGSRSPSTLGDLNVLNTSKSSKLEPKTCETMSGSPSNDNRTANTQADGIRPQNNGFKQMVLTRKTLSTKKLIPSEEQVLPAATVLSRCVQQKNLLTPKCHLLKEIRFEICRYKIPKPGECRMKEASSNLSVNFEEPKKLFKVGSHVASRINSVKKVCRRPSTTRDVIQLGQLSVKPRTIILKQPIGDFDTSPKVSPSEQRDFCVTKKSNLLSETSPFQPEAKFGFGPQQSESFVEPGHSNLAYSGVALGEEQTLTSSKNNKPGERGILANRYKPNNLASLRKNAIKKLALASQSSNSNTLKEFRNTLMSKGPHEGTQLSCTKSLRESLNSGTINLGKIPSFNLDGTLSVTKLVDSEVATPMPGTFKTSVSPSKNGRRPSKFLFQDKAQKSLAQKNENQLLLDTNPDLELLLKQCLPEGFLQDES